jgi:hypothetical protein
MNLRMCRHPDAFAADLDPALQAFLTPEPVRLFAVDNLLLAAPYASSAISVRQDRAQIPHHRLPASVDEGFVDTVSQ